MANQHCEICYQSIASDPVLCQSCDQDYHRSCLIEAVKGNKSCPMCKSDFSTQYMLEQSLQSDPNVQQIPEGLRLVPISEIRKTPPPEPEKPAWIEQSLWAGVIVGGIGVITKITALLVIGAIGVMVGRIMRFTYRDSI